MQTAALAAHRACRVLCRACKMDEANPVLRPTLPGQKYSKDDDEADIDTTTYRKWAGGILWAAITCHPQIAASATIACRFMAKPTANGHALMKRILRYMAKDPDRGIIYSCKTPKLKNYEKIKSSRPRFLRQRLGRKRGRRAINGQVTY